MKQSKPLAAPAVSESGASESAAALVNRRVRFLKVWGHPTRNEVCGPGVIANVSERVGKLLVDGKYAEWIV